MNYAELTATVQTYLENDDPAFTSLLPTFVQQAEMRILNSVQLPAMRQVEVSALSPGVAIYTLPETTLSVFEVAVVDGAGKQYFMQVRDPAFLREAYPDTTQLGTPESYAMTQPLEITFAPVPDAAYTMRLTVYRYPESIVTAGTSWLGDKFPMTLLYGTIVEGYTMMKGNADVMKMYEGRYQESLALLKRTADGLDRTDAFRTPQVKINIP